jgi:hypothetical protein
MEMFCQKITQEKFLDYQFDSINIKGLRINNNQEETIHVTGQTYLFASYAAYGHSLMDVYSQYRILQKKYPELKPFFYEDGWHGYFFNNNKISTDLINNLGYSPSDVKNIANGNYYFDEVILFFDMNNTFPENFYQSYGVTRSSNYFPFCHCYMGTDVCGKSEYFKYNYLAIDMLKNDFNKFFNNEKTENIFVSRERYNQQYKQEIDFYDGKDNLSSEQLGILNRAKMRYYDKEKDVEDLFRSNGYTVIYAEDLSLIEQIKIFSSAKKIVTISGTSLFNAFWCNKETTLFEILAVPNYRYHYKEFSEYSGANHEHINVVGIELDELLDKIMLKVINSDVL